MNISFRVNDKRAKRVEETKNEEPVHEMPKDDKLVTSSVGQVTNDDK